MPTRGAGEARTRTLYLSIDPTTRIWMSDMEQYMPPVAIGDVMRGGGIGRTGEACLGQPRGCRLMIHKLEARPSFNLTFQFKSAPSRKCR